MALSIMVTSAGSGCKPTTATSTLKDEAASAPAEVPLLFIYTQGFFSCSYSYSRPNRRFQEAVAAATQVTPGAKLRTEVIEGCFTGGVLQGGTETLFVTLDGQDGVRKPMETNPDAFVAMVNTRIRLASRDGQVPVHVFVAGHSHGGWLAQKIVAEMQGKAVVHRLLTVDAISYLECGAAHITLDASTSLFSPIVAALGPTSGCTQAPPDLAGAWPGIAAKAGQWFNFYQTQGPALHSGPIKDATFNLELDYKGIVQATKAHAAILSDARVWDPYFATVARDLASLAASATGGDGAGKETPVTAE